MREVEMCVCVYVWVSSIYQTVFSFIPITLQTHANTYTNTHTHTGGQGPERRRKLMDCEGFTSLAVSPKGDKIAVLTRQKRYKLFSKFIVLVYLLFKTSMEFWLLRICTRVVLRICTRVVLRICTRVILRICTRVVVRICRRVVLRICTRVVLRICTRVLGDALGHPRSLFYLETLY